MGYYAICAAWELITNCTTGVLRKSTGTTVKVTKIHCPTGMEYSLHKRRYDFTCESCRPARDHAFARRLGGSPALFLTNSG